MRLLVFVLALPLLLVVAGCAEQQQKTAVSYPSLSVCQASEYTRVGCDMYQGNREREINPEDMERFLNGERRV